MKPENILIESSQNGYLQIKISDFGFSCLFDPNMGLNLSLGSPLYMAPEIIRDSLYNEKVDVWSIGIIAYWLIAGVNPYPFSEKDDIRKFLDKHEISVDRD